MGRWRLAGQQRRNSDGGTNGGNGVGDNASGSGRKIWGGAQERLGLAREASSGAGGRWDVGGAQQRKGANGGSGSRDSLERGAVRSGCKPRAVA